MHFYVSGANALDELRFFFKPKILISKCNELDFHLSFVCLFWFEKGECIFCNKFGYINVYVCFGCKRSTLAAADALEYSKYREKP